MRNTIIPHITLALTAPVAIPIVFACCPCDDCSFPLGGCEYVLGLELVVGVPPLVPWAGLFCVDKVFGSSSDDPAMEPTVISGSMLDQFALAEDPEDVCPGSDTTVNPILVPSDDLTVDVFSTNLLFDVANFTVGRMIGIDAALGTCVSKMAL